VTAAPVDAPLVADRWQDQVGAIGRQVGVPVSVAIVVLTILGAGAGWFITSRLGEPIDAFDAGFAEGLVERRTATWNGITGASTVLADSLTVAVLWVAAMVVAAWRTRSWRIPMFLMAAIGGEKLTYLFTSLVVGRPRPDVESLGHVYATRSFPSGHVGSAIVLYGGLVVALLWARRHGAGRNVPSIATVVGALVAAAITVLVGFARMYRGHHYASDIAWGVLLGIAWLVIGWRTALRPGNAATSR
jgi:undecaprenyl-diphosphatase